MASNVAYNIDCMEFLKTVPDKFFDLAVCDPPYGLEITGKNRGGEYSTVGDNRPFGGNGAGLRTLEPRVIRANFYPVFDDSSPPNEEYFRELFRVSKHSIIWGGNFFLDYLGRATCMIVWDKGRRNMDQADCEIAWTDLPRQNRVFEYLWNGMLQGNMKEKEQRIHATQKPVALYAWIFNRWAKPGMKILDTHLGSGSSRIAAYEANLDFVGCEIDETYFRLQEERFERHTAQTSLFVKE